MHQMIFKLSGGNPGAVTCLIALMSNTQDLDTGASIYERDFIIKYIEKNNIIGTDLNALYSDISGKNLGVMHHIVKNAPVNDVINAASKQDYSGRETLKKYIEDYAINGRT